MVKHIAISLCVAPSVSLFGSASLAADVSPPPSPTDAPLDQGWRYQVTLYAWASAINGDVGIRGLPPADVDLSAWDAIQHLDGALSGSLLADYDDYGFVYNVTQHGV